MIEGSIARLLSSYPSIRVQTQGVQQQELPCVRRTPTAGCRKCGRGDVTCVYTTKIPSSFGWGWNVCDGSQSVGTLIVQDFLPDLAPSQRSLVGGCWGFSGPVPLPLWMRS